MLRAALAALLVAVLAARRSTESGQDLAENPYFSIHGASNKEIQGEYGSYLVGRKLGAGAYGVVYLATESSGRTVVAKLIDIRMQESVVSFQTERRIWKHMQSCKGYPHPNVIRHYEVLQVHKSIGVVIMELAAGGSLSDTLYRGVTAETGDISGYRKRFGDALLTDESLAKSLYAQLAAGAQWLAQCGVVHKDLKPDNIMLSKPFLEGGVLKIIDFGLAMLTSDTQGGALANMYYNLFSSVHPSNQVGTRTFDDFALGLILAEIGTGVPPMFNPPYDYYSNKGNLEQQKGILYVLQPKEVCARSDKGIAVPKRELAQGKVPIREAVKEVVGRSLYYIQHGRRFPYDATENGIGNVKLLTASWLYNSPQALSLLSSLLEYSQEKRQDPRSLMSSPWLASAAQEEEAPAKEDEASGPWRDDHAVEEAVDPEDEASGQGLDDHAVEEDMEDLKAPWEDDDEEPEKVAEEVPQVPSVTMCKSARKKVGPASLCRLQLWGNEECHVRVSCNGAALEIRKVERGFSGGSVPNCYNCRLA